jgi:hypothetical protein
MNMPGVTPLCHCVTSPPQGGRLFFSSVSIFVMRAKGLRPISPLAGEMSRRDRGGYASAHSEHNA